MEDENSQMQMVEYQLRQMQQVTETIDNQLLEVQSTIDNLQEISSLKGNEEVLFPVANGIFVKGKISDNKTLKMNVGSNTIVEKSITEAIDMMRTQYTEMESYRVEVENQITKLLKSLEGK